MEQHNGTQSGSRAFLNILAFIVGTIVLLLVIKYALGI